MSSIATAGGTVPKEASLPQVVSSESERRLLQVYPDDNDSSATAIDIIALHGLATDGEITWKHDNKKIGIPVNWLRDKHMLPDRIPNSRIMTYDWNATVRKDVSDMTLANEAVRLIKTIQLDRREKKKRTCPILFIASCFGGLLLAKALVEAKSYQGHDNEEYREILNSTRGIVFLSTPFRGSWEFGTEYHDKIIDHAKEKGEHYSRELIQYLKPTKTYLPSPLNDLTRHFEFIVKERESSLRVTCFSESRKSNYGPRLRSHSDVFKRDGENNECDSETKVDDERMKKTEAQGGSEIVVDPTSASLNGASHIALDLRHNMMNKFNDPKGKEYRLVVGELETFARFALSVKTELTGEKASRQNDLDLSDLQDYIYDMPDLCHPYQDQSAIRDVITKFCDSNGNAPKKLVLGGFTGRGKTQSCIAFMQLMQERRKKDIEERGRLRLLWVAGQSPSTMFDSLKRLHEFCISGKHQPTFNTLRSAQGAEALAQDVTRWLSEQSTPWLMIIDHIDDYLELDHNRDDELGLADRVKMLELLYRARNGRIIATASQYPKAVAKSPWQKHPVGPMDELDALELVHRHLSGNDSPLDLADERAARKLCKTLDFLPCGIAIACSTIKARKITIDTYIRNWHEVFEGTAKADEQRSLAASFLLCLQALKDRCQQAEEILNILVCLNTSRVSEEIFQRAWQSTRFSDGQHSAVCKTEQKHPSNAFEIIWNLIGLVPSTNDRHNRYSALDFMIPKPGETFWHDSSARRHLLDTLSILEQASFLQFSHTRTDCVIRVQPIIKTWMRRSYISGVLKADINHAWWQAFSIVAASLKPTGTMPDRDSESFLAFQKHVADQINQLACMKDSPEFQKSIGDSSGFVSSLTTNDLFFGQEGASQIHIADALDLQGYSALALQIRVAPRQSDSSKTSSLEQLAKLTTLADSLTQNGRHREALKEREAALGNVETLSVPTFPGRVSIRAHVHIRKLYRLIIENDIAESYWNLSRKQEALEKYNEVRQAFEKIIAELEQGTDSGNTRVRGAISEPLNQARLGYAECLVYHRQEYDEARNILGMVLKAPRSFNNMQSGHTYLRARSLHAYIMFIRGYYRDALMERYQILQQWKSKDAEMKHLETMKAQVDYANSLIVSNRKGALEDSMRLINDVMARLSTSDIYMSLEFTSYSKQDLARCYIEIANNDFDTNECKYKAQAQLKVHNAATLMQEVWEDLQGRAGRGHTHPETLKSLALLIKYERYTEICTGDRSFPKTMHIQALEETRTKIFALEEQSDDIKRAWLYVQLEECLVSNQAKRIRLLELLLHPMAEKTAATSKDPVSGNFYLEVRYQLAMAQMAPLRYCADGKQRNKMKKDQKFADAAKELTEVWRQRYAIRGLGNHETIVSLESALLANESVNNRDCIILQAWRCATCAEFDKDRPGMLAREEKILHRLQNDRGIKPPKLWTVIREETHEWLKG